MKLSSPISLWSTLKVAVYDPKTQKFNYIDTCLPAVCGDKLGMQSAAMLIVKRGTS